MSTLQNPQFNKSATYVIFAHLLRQVSSLTDGEHQFLVHWFRRLLTLFTCFRTLITPFKSCAFLVCTVTVLYTNPCYIHVHCSVLFSFSSWFFYGVSGNIVKWKRGLHNRYIVKAKKIVFVRWQLFNLQVFLISVEIKEKGNSASCESWILAFIVYSNTDN